MDILSYVMGMNAGKESGGGSSSGGGGALTKHFRGTVSISGGTSNERVSVNFGFKPDFLIVFKSSNAAHKGDYFMYAGYSERFASAVQTTASTWTLRAYSSSDKLVTGSYGSPIDGTTSSAINNADETGFTIANYWASAGTYIVVAFGME